MLKIKDNVDLKELEKFGFNKKGKEGIGDKAIDYITDGYDYRVYLNTRQIESFGLTGYENDLSTLYKLVKADLVEEVEE